MASISASEIKNFCEKNSNDQFPIPFTFYLILITVNDHMPMLKTRKLKHTITSQLISYVNY